MQLAPLLNAQFPIPLHALAAIVALGMGTAQLLLPKGTRQHRLVGYGFISLMAATAISSLFISTIRMWGPFSPIHLLVPLTLWTIYRGWKAARIGDIRKHKLEMIILYVIALVVTGGFTLLPGRIMNQVLFGG